MEEKRQLKLIIVLSDAVRGHLNQSRGVAKWLAEATGAEILEAEVPLLTGFAKVRARLGTRRLMSGNRRDARDWMSAASGDMLLRRVGQWFAERDLHEGSNHVLIISAGSAAAPYNLALGYVWRCACATVMTPSFLGTDLFDYAVVPEHDFPERKPNIFVTLGSPNSIDREDLKKEAEKLLAEFPPKLGRKWSLLIGGSDANYAIDAAWVKREVGRVLQMAEKMEADLYITTSRRTSKEAEAALETIAAHSPNVRYLLPASRDAFNPIPAMLGFSDEVFCTDDSVNMVSETVTGGRTAVLLRTGRRKGLRRFLQKLTAFLVDIGALPRKYLWGIPRFDILYDRLMRHGVLIGFDDWITGGGETLSLMPRDSNDKQEFNEAKRAAEWICRGWQYKSG